MESLLTTSNITFALGLLGLIFGVYHYFKTPQIEEEKKQGLLAQQVQWEKENTSNRFLEVNSSLKDATTLAQNHIHTIDVKVDNLISVVNDMNVKVTSEISRLSTIIEERVPKK